MNEQKLKHLEFLQNTIIRMGNNSFIVKGWIISIIVALFVLAQNQSDQSFVLVAYFVIPTFWILDGYFLSQERKFRDVYNQVRILAENQIDFNMDTSFFNTNKNSLIVSMFSISVFPIYLMLNAVIFFLLSK
jgi:hypothetical protein